MRIFYFQLLQQQSVFQSASPSVLWATYDDKDTHLKNFYLILPPLAVNYIEHITASKEKIFKKNLDGAAFTDDGFSMGLAYCLTLLDQWKQTDSLHWFESVEKTLVGEKKRVENQRAGEKDEKLQNTLTLTLKRLETTIREFQLLHFSVTSARIFFQANISKFTLNSFLSFSIFRVTLLLMMTIPKAQYLEMIQMCKINLTM